MFITSVRLDRFDDSSYIRDLPVVRHLQRANELPITSPVTFFVGDNGSGKSTLIEAIAVAAGFNAEGGSLELRYATDRTESNLHRWLTLRGRATLLRGYFLRAETHYTTVSAYDRLPFADRARSRHLMSHGESVLDILGDHVDGAGLYIFDEPEAGLSVVRQMALIAEIHQAVERGAQFLIATHSPILLAVPGASILEINEAGMHPIDYGDAEAVRATREFLADPQGTVDYLLE